MDAAEEGDGKRDVRGRSQRVRVYMDHPLHMSPCSLTARRIGGGNHECERNVSNDMAHTTPSQKVWATYPPVVKHRTGLLPPVSDVVPREERLCSRILCTGGRCPGGGSISRDEEVGGSRT